MYSKVIDNHYFFTKKRYINSSSNRMYLDSPITGTFPNQHVHN